MFEFLEENWFLLALLVVGWELLTRGSARVSNTPGAITVTNSGLTNKSGAGTGVASPILTPGSGVTLSPSAGGGLGGKRPPNTVNELHAPAGGGLLGEDPFSQDETWGDDE